MIGVYPLLRDATCGAPLSPLPKNTWGTSALLSTMRLRTWRWRPVPNTATYTYLADSPLISQLSFTNNGALRMTTTRTHDHLDRLTQADMMGFTLPRKYGGLNCPNLVYTMATEMISRADTSLMNLFGLQGIAETINAFASEELKQQYLPPMADGRPATRISW